MVESKSTNSNEKTFPLRVVIGFVIYVLVTPFVLFLSAGTLRWTMGWIFSGLIIVLTLASRLAMFRWNPGLAQERGNFRDAEDVKPWDRVLGPITGVFGNLLILIVAGLDHRFGWSPDFADAVPWIALGAAVLALAFSTWALVENRYFSAVVRIQADRGHQVCDTGPYRYVRHPGYLGGIIFYMAMPFILGALWALIPAVLTCIAVVIRTAFEDDTLKEELDGYEAYAGETRYRLVPFIW